MMHRLVSPFISQQQSLGKTEGKLNATALFFDVAGFGTITSTLMEQGQHGAEALSRLMRQLYEPVIQTIYAQGGFITVFAGDAFTALFTDEILTWYAEGSSASAELRALTAAWTIREIITEMKHIKTPYATFEIAIKLGMASGLVEWGIITTPDKQDGAYYFRGTPIDDAASAEKFSEGNDLILSPSAQASLTEYVIGQPVKHYFRVTKLTTASSEPQTFSLPAVTREQQAAFYPAAVFDQSPSGEFRRTINVFISFQGNPNGEQLRSLVQKVLAKQAIYGGFLNRIDFGDKGCSMLLFWGAPTSYENDAERALDFLLALQEDLTIPIRAGVTQRIAHTGFVGSDHHEEYTCNGIGVNMAARLMTSAPWESIWIDQPIAERASDRFDVEREGQFPFKGFEDPQPVYVLLGQKSIDIASFFQGKMIGRERESAALHDFVRPTLTPENMTRFAGIMHITGEAGMGKSRLVHHFQYQTENPSANLKQPNAITVQWFLCQTDQLLQQPLNPFRYWLNQYFGQSREQSEARNKRNFSRKLFQLTSAIEDPELISELERTNSFLGALVDLYWEDSLYDQLEPELRFTNSVTALKTLLLAESRRRPVIILLEDIQWLDDASRHFVTQFVRNISAFPIALIVTARDHISTSWLVQLSGVSVSNLRLNPFDLPELVELAGSVLGGALDGQTVEMLAQRSGGNPFFAEQLLHFMREKNLLIRNESTWVPDPDVYDLQLVPANIRHIFTVRLDNLEREVRELVQTAAILGRQFNVPVLQHMVAKTGDLKDLLIAAENADIWTGLSQYQYIFRNMLLRDVAYDMQVQTRQQELHLIAAQTLEELYANDLAAFYGQIAYHYEMSKAQGDAQTGHKARRYLRLAGEQAASNYENQAAIDYFSRALALASPQDTQEKFEIILGREQAYQWEGKRDAQKVDIETLIALAEEIGDAGQQAAIAIRQAQFGLETADFPLAVSAAEVAIASAESAGDSGQLGAARRIWGDVLWRQGDFAAAKEQLEAALIAAQNAGDRQNEAKTMRTLGIVRYFMDEPFHEIEQAFMDSLWLSKEIGERTGEGANLGNLGQVYGEFGQLDKSFDYLKQAEKCLQEIGFRFGQLHTFANIARMAKILGNIPQAVQYVEKGLELSRDIEEPSQEAHLLVVRSTILRQRGEMMESKTLAREALQLARTANSWEIERMAILALGRTQNALREFKEAEETYQAGLAQVADKGDTLSYLLFLVGLAEVYNASDRARMAMMLVAEIIHVLAESRFQRVLEGISFLFLTCYRSMEAVDHPRKEDMLITGYHKMLAEAHLIEDEDARTVFLEHAPENRALKDIAAVVYPKGVPGQESDLTPLFKRPTKEALQVLIAKGTTPEEAVEKTFGVDREEYILPKMDETVEPSQFKQIPSETSENHLETITPSSGDLSGAGLSGAVLNRFTLAGWQFRGTDLSGAQLRAADLRGANFRGADLRGANMRAADLSGANLAGADLREAALDGAKLSNVLYDDSTHWPDDISMPTK